MLLIRKQAFNFQTNYVVGFLKEEIDNFIPYDAIRMVEILMLQNATIRFISKMKESMLQGVYCIFSSPTITHKIINVFYDRNQ